MSHSLRRLLRGAAVAALLGVGCGPAGIGAGASLPLPEPLSSTTADAPAERVVRIEARRYEFSPSSIHLERGEPVLLELVSLDREHGFAAPDLGLQAEIRPEAVTRLRFVPDAPGTFPFHCDVFCGSGHEDMTGELVVTDRRPPGPPGEGASEPRPGSGPPAGEARRPPAVVVSTP